MFLPDRFRLSTFAVILDCFLRRYETGLRYVSLITALDGKDVNAKAGPRVIGLFLPTSRHAHFGNLHTTLDALAFDM